MADSPRSVLGTRLSSDPASRVPEDSVPRATAGQSDILEVAAALRHALSTGTQPPASVIHAATEFARILTGASGVALGMRVKGAVVCRARTGEIAPELGAALNADSGIAGECLRTAAIQICNDAETDPRVDVEVCRALSIRSIAAVPLRGSTGMMGLLEAFSIRASAFSAEKIDALRSMAEIVEAATEQEGHARNATPVQVETSHRSPSLTRPVLAKPGDETPSRPARRRHFWTSGIAIVALILVSGAVWLSWHDPALEMAASEPPAQSAKPQDSSSQTAKQKVLRTTFLTGDSGFTGRKRSERSRTADVRQNAAQLQAVDAGSTYITGSESGTGTEKGIIQSAADDPADKAPPLVAMVVSAPLPGLTSKPNQLPALDAKVSEGVTPATLIHEVPPTYPAQARMQRLAGSVVLDVMIAESGGVRDVQVIEGPPLLVTAATEAVQQWRYSPALLDGKPTEMQKRITVVFKLP